jgi:hypothetical protein
MKIVITADDGSNVSWEAPNSCTDITNVVHQFKGLLVAAGYHPTGVDEALQTHDGFDWNLFPEEEKIIIEEDDV